MTPAPPGPDSPLGAAPPPGAALWGGRFSAAPADALAAFTRSTHFDLRLVEQDCRVLAAHVSSLAAAGILDPTEADLVAGALPSIAQDIAAGSFPVHDGDEDVHTTVERALHERVPAVAAKVRAGLSRNDRVATAFRLWILDAGEQVMSALEHLVDVLEARAREHVGTIMPGYTHLQRAQPVTLAHVLAAHAFAFTRDTGRLDAALRGVRASPLGAGALAGSTLGLDRRAAAAALFLGEPIPNTLDAVAARDFALEILAACAIAGVHASRLGEEIVLWTSSEFGFAELDDAWATGSSLMPQKKNPDVAELARGKAGRLIGSLAGLLATVKSLPLAYNRDLQEDKEPVFDAMDTLTSMLPALAGLVATMRFDSSRMAEAASDPLLLATDLAEHLLAAGVPFREAHDAVGRAVRSAGESGRAWNTWTPDEWAQVHPALRDAAQLLDPAASLRRRGDGAGLDTLSARERRSSP